MVKKSDPPIVEPLVPYIKSEETGVAEFTFRAILLGLFLGLLFNAANAYLGLKIGLTVSASIPSAVLSMFFLRILLPKVFKRAKPGTILENNIVHCFASAGEAMAGAIIFVVPAILFMGEQFTNAQVFLLGTAGGIMGLMMMIPLRYSLCIKEHESLPFPEGTACTKVLIAGDQGGVSAKPVFQGMGVGALFKFLMSGLYLWKDATFWSFEKLYKAGFGYEISPLLVGVGYLVGPRVAGVLLSGGLLGFFIIIPLLVYVGGHNIIFPGTIPISEMSTWELRSQYVKYIGAGTVAFGGLFSILKSLPDIFGSLRYSLSTLLTKSSQPELQQMEQTLRRDKDIRNIAFGGAILGFLVAAFGGDNPWNDVAQALTHVLVWGLIGAGAGFAVFGAMAKCCAKFSAKFSRTERDMPLPLVAGLILLTFLILWLTPSFHLSSVESLVVVLICFFFVAVSSRVVGIIGSTNQPVSGMTITALLTMTLLFMVLGHSPLTVKIAAIMGGACVCISIALSGDLAQDLKTAALIGATPWKVEIAQIAAVLLSAVRSGFILLLLYWAYGFGNPTAAHPHALEAPQAQLMAKLVEGATGGQLPWTLILLGGGIGLVLELASVSALQVGIGLYLPITTWPMIMVGGLLSHFTQRKGKTHAEAEAIYHQGSLYASGLIAGDALTGIVLAAITVAGWSTTLTLRNPAKGFGVNIEDLLCTAVYAVVVILFYRACLKGKRKN